MNKRLTSVVVTGAIAIGGLGAGLAALPVIASAATAEAVTHALPHRGSDALPGGRGGPGGHGGAGRRGDVDVDGHGGVDVRGEIVLEEAAGLLGLSEEELLTQLEDGKSLAAVAEAEAVERGTLVDGLVAAAQEHVQEHVEAGDITQEQAADRLADIEARITSLVESEDLRRGHGPGGRGGDLAPGSTGTSARSGEAGVEDAGLTA